MKIVSFPLVKQKINKKILITSISILVVLILLVSSGFFWFKKTKIFPEIDWGILTAKLSAFKIVKETKPQEALSEELKITIPENEFFIYEETAEPGEGISHLARKALKRYLIERGQNLNLSAEHKVYIEDYLQKKTGDYWLRVGQKITFSEDLIKEAINKSQQLSQEQLENLKQYSVLISSI